MLHLTSLQKRKQRLGTVTARETEKKKSTTMKILKKQELTRGNFGKFSFFLCLLILWKISVPKVCALPTTRAIEKSRMQHVELQTMQEWPENTILSENSRVHYCIVTGRLSNIIIIEV